MDLPPELRNRIYEAALYHQENDGVTTLPEFHKFTPRECLTTIFGWTVFAEVIENPQVATAFGLAIIDCRAFQREVDVAEDPCKTILMIKRHIRGGQSPPKFIAAHLCRKECFVQPPLPVCAARFAQSACPSSVA